MRKRINKDQQEVYEHGVLNGLLHAIGAIDLDIMKVKQSATNSHMEMFLKPVVDILEELKQRLINETQKYEKSTSEEN